MKNLTESWKELFSPPDDREIYEWANDNLTLAPILSREGKFSVEGSPHFQAPLEAFRHDGVRGIRILKPVRGGGSLIGDLCASWAVANRNSGLLWVFQDEPTAEAYAESRLWPEMKSCRQIQGLLPSDSHRVRKSDMLLNNGKPVKCVGPSTKNLQTFGYQTVITDEPWLYAPGIIANAKGRMGDFQKTESNKYLAISQGGDEDGDWAIEYNSGEEYILHVPCLSCGGMIAPEWTIRAPDRSIAGIVYTEHKQADGRYDRIKTCRSVRYRCHHCGHEHANTNATRATWLQRSKYICTRTKEVWDKANPPAEVSFRWSGIIDNPWQVLVNDWLSANEAKRTGNLQPLVAFFQKKMALNRSERSIHDSDLAFTRIEAPMNPLEGKIYEGEVRFLTADRQESDLYWVMIRAAAPDGRSRRLWFGKLFSETDIEQKRIEYGVTPDCVIVDSGYRAKGDHGVYAACIKYGWIAAKGESRVDAFWHSVQQGGGQPALRVQKLFAPMTLGDPGESASAVSGKYAPLIRFASTPITDRVFALIERGLWEEPAANEEDEMERELRIQMTAEFKKTVAEKINGVLTGRKKGVYVCPSGNNHGLDCAKMQVLGMISVGFLPDGVEMSGDMPQVEMEAEEVAP